MVILERESQAKPFFDRIKETDIVVVPIMVDGNVHPRNTTLSCLYVKIFGEDESYMIPLDHSESIGIYPWFMGEFKTNAHIYTFDKKHLLHCVDRLSAYNVIDVGFLNYMKTNQPMEKEEHTIQAIKHITRYHQDQPNLNRVVPLSAHRKWCESISERMELVVNESDLVEDESFVSYNTKVIGTLFDVESSGIFVDPEIFVDCFGENSRRLVSSNGEVYSEYNLLTSAGRPSNRYGGINYAALNKTDGSRTPFISRFGTSGAMILIDFESYHPRLIGKLLRYDLPTNIPVHQYLGEQFYGKSELTSDEYDEAKKKTFTLLYGGVTELIAETIPFFKQVDVFIDGFWKRVRDFGYFKSPIYKKKVYLKHIFEPNKQKVFNYFLQIYETENNIEVMSKIIDMLDRSVLVMYTYDSFLIDYDSSEGLGGLSDLVEMVSEQGKFPVRVFFGKNYHSMVDITDKV